MPSITGWNRLEPRAGAGGLESGLSARLHDPLWMLARQWQFGELRGEDRGSPVEARMATATTRLTRVQPGNSGPGLLYDSAAAPLEALIEGEPAPGGQVSQRRAAQAGLRFMRQLQSDQRLAAYRRRVIIAFGFDDDSDPRSDPAAARLALLLKDRVIDGRRLFESFRTAFEADPGLAGVPLGISVDPADEAAFRGLLSEWMIRHRDLFSGRQATPPSWLPRRMEYAFSVAAPDPAGELSLSAPEYRGGRLDWYSFRRSRRRLGASIDDFPDVTSTRTQVTLPSPVDFPGMPAPRWWQFEDRRIDWGSVSAGAFDLARLLLVEFALIYGNDWFLIPVELAVGSWCRTDSLRVRDSFGEEFEIPPAAESAGGRSWRLFEISAEPGAEAGRAGSELFLPPVLAASLSGSPVEELALVRDEMANNAWAIEKIVQSAAGGTIRRAERSADNSPPENPPESALTYRLGVQPPPHWYPLIPQVVRPGGRSVRLALGRVDPGSADPPEPKGVLLKELARHPEPSLFEEEVPRAGALIHRLAKWARWTNGSSHAWLARKKKTGHGEASAGTRFDTV